MNISRRVFTTLAALALACGFSGCAGQAIDQPQPGNDAEMLAPFSISFFYQTVIRRQTLKLFQAAWLSRRTRLPNCIPPTRRER